MRRNLAPMRFLGLILLSGSLLFIVTPAHQCSVRFAHVRWFVIMFANSPVQAATFLLEFEVASQCCQQAHQSVGDTGPCTGGDSF